LERVDYWYLLHDIIFVVAANSVTVLLVRSVDISIVVAVVAAADND
jgi:hypothetical protein